MADGLLREISIGEFNELLASSSASPAFREEFARYEFPRHDSQYIDAAVHEGALRVKGPLKISAFYNLVLGDLTVEGAIDLRSGWDTAGLFIVIGNVRCKHFISEYEAAVVVDGDLQADGAVLISESDVFSVMGTLQARLLVGNNTWASVGAGALVDYGFGYCLPLGDEGSAMRPRHDEQATIQALIPEPDEENTAFPYDLEGIGSLIRAGKPIFKSER